jgi:predicted phosphodiesterase
MASQEEEYAILDLMRRHEVDAHLSGHTHRWGENEIGGTRLISVSAMRESAADRTALRVDVDGGAVTYTRVPLGTT